MPGNNLGETVCDRSNRLDADGNSFGRELVRPTAWACSGRSCSGEAWPCAIVRVRVSVTFSIDVAFALLGVFPASPLAHPR
jgi:hypothetical protein